jgi:hypothetical protein
MKTKVVSLAMILGLFAFLGGCDSGTGGGELVVRLAHPLLSHLLWSHPLALHPHPPKRRVAR